MDPAPRPRSAIQKKKQNQVLNQALMVDQLINMDTHSWNVEFLNVYIHPGDVKIIKGLAISRAQRPDTYGWIFTETGKFSIKSGFRTESMYPDKKQTTVTYRPDIKHLLSFTWKLKCSLKLQHFVWQVLSGTLPVAKNLRSRGLLVIYGVLFVG